MAETPLILIWQANVWRKSWHSHHVTIRNGVSLNRTSKDWTFRTFLTAAPSFWKKKGNKTGNDLGNWSSSTTYPNLIVDSMFGIYSTAIFLIKMAYVEGLKKHFPDSSLTIGINIYIYTYPIVNISHIMIYINNMDIANIIQASRIRENHISSIHYCIG